MTIYFSTKQNATCFDLIKLNHFQATKRKQFSIKFIVPNPYHAGNFFPTGFWGGYQKTNSSWAIWQFNLGLNFLINRASSTFLYNQVPVPLLFRILKQPWSNLIKLSCLREWSLMAEDLLPIISLPVFHDMPISMFANHNRQMPRCLT